MTREEQVQEISKVLLKHPEYLYYIFDEKEYAELKVWMELPKGTATKKIQNINMFVKAFAMGLADFKAVDDFMDTVYQADGTAYAASKELDVRKVILKIQEYAGDLSYAEYSRKEIEYKAYDLANRSDWLDILFTTLHYRMKIHPYEAQDLLIQVVGAVMSGYALDEIILNLRKECEQSWSVRLSTKMWIVIAGIMLDLELPMLKGRTRVQYAEEMKCSPWTVGMVTESEQITNSKEKHIYQFSVEVQQQMYEAGEYGDEHSIEYLLDYKEQNQVYSEEYIYLLAEACITFGKTNMAEKLIGQLKRSLSVGKREARELENRLQQRHEVVDDFGCISSTNEQVQQPYVRTSAKIGRNDPCPCGSGKKYKKCCGRN